MQKGATMTTYGEIDAITRVIREQVAKDIEKQIDQDWPNDDISDAYRHAAHIARNGLR